MSAITVRFARPGDAPAIHGFIVGLAMHVGHPDEVEVTPETLARQLDSERPPFECLLAEIDGEAVGSAMFFANYSTWTGRGGLYVEDVFVPQEHRRKGVAHALFRCLAQLVAERGYARLDWAVLDGNEEAIGFYKRLGAQPDLVHRLWRLDRNALDAVATSAPKPPAPSA